MTESDRVVPIEFSASQESREDPWLCDWAEFYHLAYLSDRYVTGRTIRLINGLAEVDGENVPCLLVQKHSVEDVPYDNWSTSKLVYLGGKSALVIQGEGMEDALLIPNGSGGFRFGRKIDTKFSGIAGMMAELKIRKHDNFEYMDAVHKDRILVAMEMTDVNSYHELYVVLKDHFVNNDGVFV